MSALWLVGLSVCRNFLKERNLYVNAPTGVLVYFKDYLIFMYLDKHPYSGGSPAVRLTPAPPAVHDQSAAEPHAYFATTLPPNIRYSKCFFTRQAISSDDIVRASVRYNSTICSSGEVLV